MAKKKPAKKKPVAKRKTTSVPPVPHEGGVRIIVDSEWKALQEKVEAIDTADSDYRQLANELLARVAKLEDRLIDVTELGERLTATTAHAIGDLEARATDMSYTLQAVQLTLERLNLANHAHAEQLAELNERLTDTTQALTIMRAALDQLGLAEREHEAILTRHAESLQQLRAIAREHDERFSDLDGKVKRHEEQFHPPIDLDENIDPITAPIKEGDR